MNRLRLSIGIFRILLLLVSFQFLAPGLGISQTSKKEVSSYHHTKSKSQSLNFLFEKNEGEEIEDADEKENLSISFLTRNLIVNSLLLKHQSVTQQLRYPFTVTNSKVYNPLYLQHSLLLI